MRLLLIEDSRRLRESLELGLRRLGYALDSAADGAEGLELALKHTYDVILLDLMIPKIDGLTVLQRVRARDSASSVLILTARDAVPDRVAGLQTGADDYLTKPFAFDELVARIQALVRRKYGAKKPTMQLGALELDTTSRAVKVEGTEVTLRPREYAVLELLALRRGRIVSRRDIEECIYDGKAVIESNAVESAVCALRRCIDKPGRRSFIETRRGFGYLLRSGEDGDDE